MTEWTVADFFCGAGGFSEGFYQAGFKVIFGLDNWKPAVQTHDINHPECTTICMNILDLDTPEKIDEVIPDTDIIIGSPPCISFSNSNKSGKADKTLGVQLITQFLKIILYKKTKPNSKLKYWIMENVPNSLSYVQDVYTAKELGLTDTLPSLAVPLKNILVASHYGSPQGRKRAIAGDYVLPTITHTEHNFVYTQVIMQALGPPLCPTPAIVIDPSYPTIQLPREQLTDHLYDNELPSDWTNKAKRLKTDHGYMGKMDFPDRKDRLCRTIMATESYCSRESIIFVKEGTDAYRAPTIRELACLMGFPISYQFNGKSSTGKHKQIGNAVCVHLSLALGNAIKTALNITLIPAPRALVKPDVNLNDLWDGLFSSHVQKPKKMTSKFHIHVPNLKIKQLRVELDNLSSDFETNTFIWRSCLHKGAGKNAKMTSFSNTKIIPLLQLDPFWSQTNDWYNTTIQSHIYDATRFQEQYCDASNNSNHLSPEQTLQFVSNYIHATVEERTVSIPELDTLFQYKKPNDYSIKILYALYLMNNVVEQLSL